MVNFEDPVCNDGTMVLGRRIYEPGFGRFKDSSGSRYPVDKLVAAHSARSERKSRKTTDYGHRRMKPIGPWNLKDPPSGHDKVFYGLKKTAITRFLDPYPPKHSGHPDLKDAPPPDFHRRQCDVTEFYDQPMRCKVPIVIQGFLYPRMATDVTAMYRIIPKIFDPNDPPKWHGRLQTWITDYSCLDVEMGRVAKQRALPTVPYENPIY